MSDPRPPRLAEALLRRFLAAPDREYILGDLAEQFQERIVPRYGRWRGWLWYWRQVWQSIGPSRQHRRQLRGVGRGPSRRRPKGRGQRMETVRHDLVFALRQLRRNPAFALTVIVTLALGIGANTAIFSVIHGTLLRPLPYAEPERTVYVTARLDNAGVPATHLSGPDVHAIRERVPRLEVAAISETVILPLTDTDGSMAAVISRASWNLFDLLGARPVAGRLFRMEDGIPVDQITDRPLPIVLSHAFWQRRFGGDEGVIGRSVRINGVWPATVIGVLGPEFELLLPPVANVGSSIDFWWPHRHDDSQGAVDSHWARVVGRLKPGADAVAVQQELHTLAARLRSEAPYRERVGLTIDLHRLHDMVVGPVKGTLYLLLGAVGFVLLISCANVANLLLARGSGRRTELAVRAALGADRRRLVRQMLTESAVLAAGGALAGVALAAVGIGVLKALAPPDVPRLAQVGLQPLVLVFTGLVAVSAVPLYGLLPALQYARFGPAAGLNERGGTGGRTHRRVQTGLAVTQVALSIVLLTGAALMVRSFRELQRVPLGFDPDRLLTFRTNTLTACTLDGSQWRCDLPRVERQIQERLAGLPGVLAVGAGFPLPMNGVYDRIAQYVPDAIREDETQRREAFFRTVSPTYMEAMKIDLLAGRGFRLADSDTTVRVVIVDQTLARREWPGENPIGQRLALFGWGFDRPDAYEVVGVVEFVPQWDHRNRMPTIYVPRSYYQSIELSVAVRAAGDPAALSSLVRREMAAIHPDLPIDFVRMDDLLARSLASTRFVLTLLTVFSGMALTLASVGLYGVLAYNVRQRTREFGIRMAFGAETANVLREVMKRGTAVALVGAGLGLGAAVALGRFLERHLFGVTPLDPVALVVTTTVVLGVAVASSYLPARRAAGVDPLVALRD